MGQLVDGVWHDTWYETKSTGGHFKRSESAFRNWVTPDGAPGLTGKGGFPAQSGRYHLYVSLACPWAHRTLLMRQLKGLEDHIAVSVVHPLMLDHGWTFGTDFEAATGDSLYQHEFLYQLYLHAMPDYSGRVTVPVLWDTEQHTIVSNESADIIRMLNSAFDGVGATAGDYYPEALRAQIDELNGWIYDKVNNGVYKAGFATSQSAYDESATTVFAALSDLESILAKQRYLTGEQLTEADLRLWTTLIRFDPVYHTHFKCDKYRLSDYPNLFGFLRDIYQMPGIADTVDMAHIRHHYYRSHGTINPHGVISLGPEQDLNQPHHRDKTFVDLY
ncbi:glutathione S-transferase family protein [Pectobacterium carotovorum]|uniref:glutathione S-transferase family protein n=1 Tax=Pectobacterium carotovorum TaxID=554 RepID=UPI00191E25DB|nr:glutathione S-transferase family protein [Pectobacterium carotovorum]MBL0908612.1 glutathione S-transferase family protein [Pectobacterium carotovorum]MCA6972939.1 glutathione S-transferase family protein [Pectobacterium carotovorum]MDY4375320.1 glutathione S-transferase family protein [Pectobacterium carotovorum subsp. carotovorum]QRN37819.1 glutathione S-transferase family protein [Pectobacterium carotovorum]ULS49848.1 glutathione S-transferase family protein [Pectobacterium carotovorum]